MQRIDVMLSAPKGNSRVVTPIELKAVEATADNLFQVQRYIDWLEQYYIPNRISDIQPVLLTRKTTNKAAPGYKALIQGFQAFNSKNKNCLPIKYIEYELKNNDLEFTAQRY